jgi:glycogen debranching enzyme
MDEKILDSCYEASIEVIKACSTPNGLFASAGKDGYDAVWSRDSMISMIGASLVDNRSFKEVFKQSIIILTKGQVKGKSGQIPNCVDWYSKRKPHTDFQTIDSTLWYLIGHYIYRERYKDSSLFKRFKKNIDKSLSWLSSQDPGELGMLAQLPTSDWQDAFPHKYGHTINTQALYYKVLKLIKKDKEASHLKWLSNERDDTKLWNKDFYAPYRWKNHGQYKEIGDWFDSFGNMLACVLDLADKGQAKKIIQHIENNKINRPFPVRTIYPAIKKGTKNWQDYFLDCEAGTPNHYSNGGIWGYNGCYYVLALIKLGIFDKAKDELMLIAKRNLEGNFPEWTDPVTQEHHGMLQAWEAGAYILAYESLKAKRVLI